MRQDVTVKVGVLGQVVVDGRVVRSIRQARLLAALALDLGAAVPHDRLIEMVWNLDLPEDPASALHTVVSRLRSTLPVEVSVVSLPGAYRLDAALNTIDIQAVSAWNRGDPSSSPQDRLDLVLRLLALYRGVPFEDLDVVDAIATRERFIEVGRQLLEAQADALRSLGRPLEAADALRPLLREEPTREEAVAQFMRCSYEAGRQTEALAACADLRATLREEFGLEPQPRIAELELAILDHSLVIPAIATYGSPTTPRELPPTPLTAFIGRDEHLAQLATIALGLTQRLITILGPGGVGKTRLALELAHSLAASAETTAFVELAELGVGADVASLVADLLKVPAQTGPDRRAAIAEHIGSHRTIMILDNCEHVIGEVRALVTLLLPNCPNLTIVATSREPIAIAGEQRWPLRGLAPDAARLLFTQRAIAADPHGLQDNDPSLVDTLCTRLGGVPLSLELAAAALATIGLHDVVRGFDDPLTQPHDDRPTTSPRHRDARAVVEWSYNLLDDEDRAAFDRLGVFAGTFRIEDVASVHGPRIAGRVPSLVDRSLVMRSKVAGPTHYELLETMRAFARMQRGSSFAEDQRQHAAWSAKLAAQCEPLLTGPQEAEAFRRLHTAFANIRQGYEWLCEHGPFDARAAMLRSMVIWGWQCDNAEVMHLAIATATAGEATETAATITVAAAATIALSRSGDLLAATARAAQLVERADAAEPSVAAFAFYAAAEVAIFSGRFDDAATFGERAAADAARCGAHALEFFGSVDAALAHTYRGDLAAADTWLERAAERAQQLNSQHARAWVELCRGDRANSSDPERARLHYERSLGLCDPTTSSFLQGIAESSRTEHLVRRAVTASDLAPYASQLERWRAVEAWTFVLATLRRLTIDLTRCGEFHEAAVLLGVVLSSAPVAEADAARLVDARRTIDRRLGANLATEAMASGARLTIADATERAVLFLSNGSGAGTNAN